MVRLKEPLHDAVVRPLAHALPELGVVGQGAQMSREQLGSAGWVQQPRLRVSPHDLGAATGISRNDCQPQCHRFDRDAPEWLRD